MRRTAEYDGTIHYVVDDPYPGGIAIAYIEGTMRKAGWQPSPTSLLRLDQPDGDRSWWTYGSRNDIDVNQWDGGWTNENGDLVTYLLRYEVSRREPVARRMLVSAIYTRADTVRKMREALRIR